MQQIIVILCFIFSSMQLFSTPGDLDTTANSGTGFGNATPASALGYVVAGFTNNMNLNGSAIQSDGKIVVVGSDLTSSNAIIARYNINGTEDTSFNSFHVATKFSVTSAIANAVTVLANGKIVIVGQAVNTGLTQFYVAQYLPDGTLDTTNFGGGNGFVMQNVYSTGGDESIDIANAVAVDTSGNIYVVGTSDQVTNGAAKGVNVFIASYTSAGVLRTGTYNSTPVIGGGGDGATIAGIALLSIGSSGTDDLNGYGAKIDSSGRVVVVGSSSASTSLLIARFDTDGTLDTTGFNSSDGYNTQGLSGTDIAYAISFQSDDKIVVAGTDGTNAAVIRYTTAGLLDSYANNPTSPFGTGTAGSEVGYITSNYGGTTAEAHGISVQSDDKIVIGGTLDNDFVIARYLADGSALDTTNFNPSDGFTTTSIASPSLGNTLSMQENGSFILAGTVDTANTNLGTARYLGDSDIQGCMDISYNPAIASSPGTPGFTVSPTDATSANKPEVKALQVLSTNSVFVLTENLATSTKSQLVQLDSAGSATSANAIAAIDIAQIGGADVISDSHGRALVIGTNASNGWIARYLPTSGTPGSFALDSTFNSGAIIVQSSSPTTTGYSRVCEQESGNIIVMGQNSTTGVIVAYNQDGTVNTNFGTSGVYSISNITLTDMIIDSLDNIYVIGSVGSGNIQLYRILPDGSGLDSTYNSGSAIDIGFASASYQGAKLAGISGSGGTTLVTINSSTKALEFKRYNSTGGADTPGTQSIAQTTSLLTNPVITQLQIDSNNQPIYVGYDDYYFFIGRLNSNITIDTTFAPYSSTPGILKTKYNDNNPDDGTSPQRVANCVGISPDGSIIFGGYENIDATNTISMIGNVVGDATPYYELPRYPGAEIGKIDTDFGTNGALALLDSPASLPAGTAQAMYVLSNDKILVADATGSNTVLGQLTSAYVLDTGSFGTGTGLITLTGLVNPTDIMVDTDDNIYVVGDDGANMMLFKITSAGVLSWSITSDSLTIGNVALQQALGRIIVVGYNGSSGVIAGYNSVTGALDTTFATSGYYTTGVAAQISQAAITTTDDIVFVYKDGSDEAIVDRLLSNGIVDTTFAFGTALTAVSADISSQPQTKLQLDVNGKIIVTARNSTGHFIVRRYLATGANDVSTVTITLTNPSTSILKEILALSNGTTLILGRNTNGNTVEVARLTSAAVLDTDFNYASGILETSISPITDFYGIDVTADQGILVVGASGTPDPYFTRIFDDYVVTKVNQNTSAVGTPGTIDTNFGTSGQVLLASLSGSLTGLTPQVVLPTSTGQYYITYTDGTLIRLTNEAILDTSFDTDGFASDSSAGVSSMIIDGLGSLVLTGTTGGAGWLERYNAGLGTLDTTFNSAVSTDFPTSTIATITVEQTLGRYVVAGQGTTNGALFAFTNDGALDVTFNSSNTPGSYDTGVATGVYAMIADTYDRLIIAYKNGTNIDIVRLTSAGQLDTTFGSTGTIAAAIANADSESQVRLAFDSSGNIVVVAHINDGADKIAVKAYANSTGTSVVETQLDITGLTSPTLTNVITTTNDNVLVSGYQSGSNDMWVDRIEDNGSGAYILDTTFGGGDGTMLFNFDGTATVRILNGIAIYGDGQIAMVGTETVSAVVTPFLSMAYDTPYTTQTAICQYVKTIGTNDTTLGASSSTATDLGVAFYASSGADATSEQVARAIALQDDATILVVVDGGLTSGVTTSDIFLKMFTIDGTPNTDFGTSGQQTVLTTYQNQNIQDIVTFTTVAGVHKAILAGYVTNTTLSVTGSLLLQYDLDTPALDTANFGGLNSNPAGIAYGDGKQINVIGQQSNGRIIAGGLSQDDAGLLLGYTSTGKLDTSFGAGGGYQSANMGSTGLYTHAIDAQNRIIIAYNDASNNVAVSRILADGSGLDTSFGTGGSVTDEISGISGNSNMRVAIDTTNQVFVAAVNNSGVDIVIKRYTNTGTIDDTLTVTSATLGTLTDFTISKLLVDTDGKVIIVGYDNAVSDEVVTIRTLADLTALDTTFNPDDTPGYLKYAVASGTTQITTDALIHPDGRIIVAGSEV